MADKKVKVKEDLAKLEEAKLLSSDEHFQEMVNLIAQDIRNQRRYREMRREVNKHEMLLHNTLLSYLACFVRRRQSLGTQACFSCGFLQ